MRLLYLNHNVAFSGTFFRALHLGRELVRRGHEVTVVTTSRAARLRFETRREDGVRLVLAPDLLSGRGRTGWDPWNTLRRVLRLRGEEPDLVHAFDSRPAVILPALSLRRASGAPLVLDWADWWGRGGTIEERSGPLVRSLFGPVETWFEEAFRTRADGTTVICSALAERARSLGVPAERMLQFPQGCDPGRLRPQPRAAARAALGIDGGTPLLLHLGVAVQSDLDLLLAALQRLRARRPDASLVLVGDVRSRVPPELVASGAVRRAGRVSLADLGTWLAAADLAVIPLRDTIANRGRWPSKVNDYLAAGRPVLMTDVGDAAAWIRDSGAGWVAAADADALASGADAALADEPARTAAGARARALAEGGLSWQVLADGVERFYRGIGA